MQYQIEYDNQARGALIVSQKNPRLFGIGQLKFDEMLENHYSEKRKDTQVSSEVKAVLKT